MGFIIPVENYTYSIDTDGPFELDEEDDHLLCLLRWVKDAYIEYTADDRVIFEERVIYFVRSCDVEYDPSQITMQVFDVDDQQRRTIVFRCRKPDDKAM